VAPYHKKGVYANREDLYKPIPSFRDKEIFDQLAKKVIADRKVLLDYNRLYTLWQAIQNTAHMGHVIAEVGSYRGGSAYFLASAAKEVTGCEVTMHIFDTFEGHPSRIDPVHDSCQEAGMFNKTSHEQVKEYLAPFSLLKIHKGEFSQIVKDIESLTYGLVHIDVDIYRSTLDCLEYFWPKMATNGIIVVDDFGANTCTGVQEAIEQFLKQNNALHIWYMHTEQITLVKV
jgi:predicted O-methyltransferase YrrM